MSSITVQKEDHAAPWLPRSIRFSHITLPSRNLADSKRFFVDILGGELREEGEKLRVHFTNFDIVAVLQEGGATAPHLEYPHYAFTVASDQFVPLKQRLEAYGIPTHDPWTRSGETHSIMYFRDPSENQFELFCPEGDVGLELRLGNRAGGDYVVPYTELVYDELKDREAIDAPKTKAIEFNHMTIPTTDFGQCRRFFTKIFGGDVPIDLWNHVTITVGGFDIGYGGPADADWPWPDGDLAAPRYSFAIDGDELPLMVQRLHQFGVPTSEIWSPDGVGSAVFFRDPPGNLWELVCEDTLVAGVRRDGDYHPDLKALKYESWADPGD